MTNSTFVPREEEVRKITRVVWYSVKNATDIWQSVDGGVDRILMIGHEQQDWLEYAKRRRILITQWVGEVYSKLCSPEYDNLRWRCFERTCCLITADGSDDHLITPEGLGYVVPPPLPTLSSDEPMAVEVPPPRKFTR